MRERSHGVRSPISRVLVHTVATAVIGAGLIMVSAAPSWATAPKISNFTPVSGTIGTKITITGSNLTGAKAVKFNGVSAVFKVSSATKITATVPPTTTNGKISVTTSGGTAKSAATFTVLPSMSSFTPSSGVIGSSVTISGGGFVGTTSVKFNGVVAAYTVNSPNQITTTVPPLATTGTIAVTTPAGTTTSGSAYTVLPHIASFAPSSAAIGSSVVITGSGFTGVTGVTFNGQAAVFTVDSPTQITATVPQTTTGPIGVTTTSGTATSASSFVVLPSLTLTAASGPPTSSIGVNGYGFGPNSLVDVYFDATDMALIGTGANGTFTGLKITVPGSAAPGTHYVSGSQRGSGSFGQTPFLVNTNWSMFRNSPSHRGYNPFENVVGPTNVGNLFQSWAVATNGVPTSPAVVNGTMYVGSSNFNLYAFDASTGAQLWSFATTAAITASPAVQNGAVYIVSSDGKLWAVDASTGLAVWGSPVTLSGTSTSSPTVVGGIVFVGTSTGNLYAIDATSGSVDWTAAPGAGGVSTSPAVANGDVVFTTSSSHALAYNATAGGGQLWNVTLGGSLTTPLIVSGSVYFGSSNANIYALSLATGVTQWNNNPSGFSFASAPSYANGLIYIGSNDGTVYAFDTTGGNPWNNGNGTAYQSPIALADGVVYAGSNDNGIYAFAASNGNLLWSGSTNGQVKASPVIVNGMLYVSSNDGHVYEYDLSSTQPLLPIRRPTAQNLRPDQRLSEVRL